MPQSFHSLRHTPDAPAPSGAADHIDPADALRLLQLTASLGAMSASQRDWRSELLSGLLQILSAAAGMAFTLRDLPGSLPAIVSMSDAGLEQDARRTALLNEFQTSPFKDPYSRLVFERLSAQQLSTLTCLRAQFVSDTVWNGDAHVLTLRRPAGLGDCLLSVHRTDHESVYALLFFRNPVTPPAPGTPNPGFDVLAAARFGPRERLLLDTLHRGLDGLYRAEAALLRINNRSSELTPRLRETLDHLLLGLTERQTAMKMSLSVHTVHDYVKALYTHFGVSNRTALLARWLQIHGRLPDQRP